MGTYFINRWSSANIATSVIIDIALTMLVLLLAYIIMVKHNRARNAELLFLIASARDRYTQGHMHHVYELVQSFVNYLHSDIRRKLHLNVLFKSAKLHDIGKLLVPGHLLNKSSKLTDQEMETLKSHAKTGYTLSMPLLGRYAANIILYHHENWDGTGYLGKAGNEIPLESQIIRICDVYSALVNDRLYRKAVSHEEALKTINEGCGTLFNEELVLAFNRFAKDNPDIHLHEFYYITNFDE